MKLFFVRHAESNGNATGDYSTDAHDCLSPKGLTQADELAASLHEESFDRVYCSPLRRTAETITPYVRAQDCAVEIWPELAEACWQEDRSIHPEDEPRYIASDALELADDGRFSFRDGKPLRPPEDETYSEAIARLKHATERLLHRHRGNDERILIVSHGHAMSRRLELLLEIEPVGRFDHANTAVSLLAKSPHRIRATYINRTASTI